MDLRDVVRAETGKEPRENSGENEKLRMVLDMRVGSPKDAMNFLLTTIITVKSQGLPRLDGKNYSQEFSFANGATCRISFEEIEEVGNG